MASRSPGLGGEGSLNVLNRMMIETLPSFVPPKGRHSAAGLDRALGSRDLIFSLIILWLMALRDTESCFLASSQAASSL